MRPASIATAGSGRMGRSIALAYAYAGERVVMLDMKARSAADYAVQQREAAAEISTNLQTLQRIGVIEAETMAIIAERVSYCPFAQAEAHLQRAELVFEAVPEITAVKQDAFKQLEAALRGDCVVASTTSTMLSTQLSQFFSRPQRFLNAHWLNPAYLIPLVEVSPHSATADAALQLVIASLQRIGKSPVVCKPSAGYIVPRLQALVMNEAARLVEEGVASAEQIDLATRLGFGMRYAAMGVLEFVDFGGVDILHHANRYLAQHVSAQRFAQPEVVNTLMRDGHTGLRAAQGFYDWRTADVDAYRDQVLKRFTEMLRQQQLLRPPVL